MTTYEILLSELKKGTVRPVYVFSGEEEYIKRELEQKIKSFLTNNLSSESFNCEVLDGKECDAGSLAIRCKTIPFFSSTRLVVVRNADELCSEEELIEYVKNPSPTTCLILMVKKSVSALKEYEIKLSKLYPGGRADWIKKKVGEFKKGISFDAMQLLQEMVGENLERLSSEIEKLVLFVGEKPSISKEDVQNIYPQGSGVTNIFDLVDALGNRKKKQALGILKGLVLTEDTGKILSMIGRQFRLILQSKELMKKGYSQAKISEEIEIKQSWLVRRLLEQSKNFSSVSLIDKLENLANAELDIKTSKIPPLFSLEILVSRLCS